MAYKETGIPAKDVIEMEVGDYSLKLNKPGKKEVWHAFRALTMTPGEMDMARAGEVIFETCAVGYDDAITADPRIFLAVCLDLAGDYVAPADVEIKKKPAA